MKIKGKKKPLKLDSVSTLGPFQACKEVCAKRMRNGWWVVIVARWGLREHDCVLYSHACVLPTGSCRHNSNQEDRRLPPPALEPGQTAANDRGDNGQRQGAGPDRAHLLAVHKWRTGAKAQVILPLFGCSNFWLSSGHPAAFWAQSVFLGIGWGTRHPHRSRSGCSPDLGPVYLRLISENLLTK